MSKFTSGVRFKETNWDLVERIRTGGDGADTDIETLIHVYKDPLYGFLRMKGYSPHDSEDLIQEFLIRFVESDWVHLVDKKNGKLRSYLLGSLKRVMVEKYRHEHAIKRGGNSHHEAVDERDDLTTEIDSPDSEFDKAWSRWILDSVLKKLYESFPKQERKHFGVLAEFLNWNSRTLSYHDAAEQMCISVPALKSRVFRMRSKFKEILREEVAMTLINPTPDAVNHELEALKSCW